NGGSIYGGDLFLRDADLSNLAIAGTILIEQPPPASPTDLADVAIINGFVNAAHDTSAQTVTGNAAPGSTVTVYDQGQPFDRPLRSPIRGGDGHWTAHSGGLGDRPHTLYAVATDAAGTSQHSSELSFFVATQSPSATISGSVSGATYQTNDTISVTASAE